MSGRQHDDHLLADLDQQVVKARALLGVEARGGFVDDDQQRAPSSACAIPKRWRMPPE